MAILKEGLLKDIAEAEAKTQESARGRGQVDIRPNQQTGFMPKAIRYKNKLIGQKELSDLTLATGKTIEKMLDVAGIEDQEQRRQASFQIQQRMNKFNIDQLKKGAEFSMKQMQRMTDAQRDIASKSMMEGIASIIPQIIAGPGINWLKGAFGKKAGLAVPTTTGEILKSPGTASRFGASIPMADVDTITLDSPTMISQNPMMGGYKPGA